MRVLISGAGIAGPALAHWLHRYGIEPVVVELAPGLRPGGHAVDIRGSARRVVERMGLLDAIRAARTTEQGMALLDRHGRRTATMGADAFGGEGIVAEIEIVRGDLSRILYDATAPYTDYRFGDRITALAGDGSGVDVTFAGGGPERFDVVVGADGVHSGVRALAFGPETEFLHYLGAYSAYFTVPGPPAADQISEMYNAPGGRVALVRTESDGVTKAMLSVRAPHLGDVRLTRAQQQELLRERLAGAGWRVDEFLAAMPGAADFYFDSLSQVRVDRWWRGRVALVGDAGYCGSPLVGLGTSASLIGAYTLAGELASAPDRPEAAFAAYQQAMAGFVGQVLQLPPGGIRMFAPKSRAVLAARALSWRMMTRWPMRQLMAKQFGKADGVVLRDYAGVGRAALG